MELFPLVWPDELVNPSGNDLLLQAIYLSRCHLLVEAELVLLSAQSAEYEPNISDELRLLLAHLYLMQARYKQFEEIRRLLPNNLLYIDIITYISMKMQYL